MIEVEVALQTVFAATRPRAAVATALTHAALGLALAEDLRADLDSPPFAKALMDGYAVRSADLPGGTATLTVVGEVQAGGQEMRGVNAGEALRIFTGAPMPAGADAVVKQELATPIGDQVTLSDPSAKPGRNVMPRGQEMRAGEVVLRRGGALTPVALGVAATIGATRALAVPPATVAILVTGDELVEPGDTPTGAQIRNSNGPLLAALVARAGAVPVPLGIARDDESALASLVRLGLGTGQVLLLAGGVSAGKFDLVPDVLRASGVEIVFHQVRMKPGKPLLFGTYGDMLVFGLPGNPVSALVSFELFVRPALRVLAGFLSTPPATVTGTLAEAFAANNDRPTYHPAWLEGDVVHPLLWRGSADLRGLLGATALLKLPAGEVNFAAGAAVEVVRI